MGGLADVIESSGLLQTVLKVAPVLGGVLGTPLCGVGLSLLAELFHVNPKDVSTLSTVINADPDAAFKIKKLEDDHIDTLQSLKTTDYQTEVTDRLSARQAAKDLNYKDFMRHMTYLVTIGFLCAMFLMFVPLNISAEEKNLLSMLVGMLASKWQTIIDFYFGSSRNNNFQGVLK